MYTQCPECGVAFRVTAEVLRQAAGQVRCGGCGVAFNALNHLSEQKPAAPVQSEPTPDAPVPELIPDAPGELEADTPPASISAEQSAALLKTLDQLAGSDIRIEDTGVEWRVIDEENVESADDASDMREEPDLIADTGSLRFIVEGDEDFAADEPAEVVEEMRFDDNTPLPDDFDFSSEPAPQPAPVIEAVEPEIEPNEAQLDFALGDPEEWQDLLGDLDEPAEPEAAVEDQEESRIEDELETAADDIVVLADVVAENELVQPPDMDTQFAIQAEAMGIDLSGVHKAADEEMSAEEEAEKDPPELDDDPETSIEDDLIAAAFESEAAAQALELATSGAGLLEIEEDDVEAEDDELGQEDEALEEELEDAGEIDLAQEEEVDEVDFGQEQDALEEGQEEFDEIEFEIDLDAEIEPDDEAEIEDDVEDIALGFDDKIEEVIETIAASLDDEDDGDAASGEYAVPEMSEEEKTLNMMIDQELFNIAVEDEDGFASTIVQMRPNKKVEDEIEEKDDSPPLVETIIMEGEFTRHFSDREELAPDRAAASRRFDDPGVSIPLKKTMRAALRGGRRDTDPPRIGVIVGVVALLLVLLLQVLHQSREALATVPAFSSAVGPLYRSLGRPLTPRWDVSGWRFEATKGSTDDTDQQLTIYSRVGNKSDAALPYPLVHVSLTDRFEDIIGSRVLEPGEYLAENADPRVPVPAGNTFNAVISIESPSAEATGFKLNVCYRLASGQLRCAIEDFK
jgi:predicted Zn finger-like uncharacterized protein